MTIAHFSIDGGWLTEHARNLVREGRWDHAMRTLVDGLEGMTTDIALRILKGDAKLVGVNDVDLADDDDAKYKEALDWHFSGVFVDSNGRYLRPYAVVTAWGSEDLCDQYTVMTPGSQRAEVSYRSTTRSWRNPLIYADNPNVDVSLEADVVSGQISNTTGLGLGSKAMVLCRVLNNYPHLLYKAHRVNDISAAITDLWDRGISLKEVGASAEPVVAADAERDTIKEAVAKITASRQQGETLDERVARQNREFAARQALKEQIIGWRERILEQAGDKLFPLTYTVKGESKTVMVPTAPFENWSLWRTTGAKLATPWEKVSPSGLKMTGDDPYHSDWMIGAGLDLDAFHEDGSDLNDVAFSTNFRLQETMLSFSASVLCGDQPAYGEAVHPKPGESVDSDKIAIIPNAGPRYLQAALTAAAVVVEQGGAMAHLVSIGREQGVTIMRVEGALKLYPAGYKVKVSPQDGYVRLMNIPVRDAFGEYED